MIFAAKLTSSLIWSSYIRRSADNKRKHLLASARCRFS
jgi:hypothetical protein